jgi:hypothetical protein
MPSCGVCRLAVAPDACACAETNCVQWLSGLSLASTQCCRCVRRRLLGLVVVLAVGRCGHAPSLLCPFPGGLALQLCVVRVSWHACARPRTPHTARAMLCVWLRLRRRVLLRVSASACPGFILASHVLVCAPALALVLAPWWHRAVRWLASGGAWRRCRRAQCVVVEPAHTVFDTVNASRTSETR